MSQNPSNSESDVISEVLQHPVQCDIHATSSGLEVTVTPEIRLQSTIPYNDGYDYTSALEARISQLSGSSMWPLGLPGS